MPKRDEVLIQYFSKGNDLVVCNNMKIFFCRWVCHSTPNEWHLFIDSSKQSLKFAFPHNGIKLAIVRLGGSVTVKKHYLTVKVILEKMCYKSITGSYVVI